MKNINNIIALALFGFMFANPANAAEGSIFTSLTSRLEARNDSLKAQSSTLNDRQANRGDTQISADTSDNHSSAHSAHSANSANSSGSAFVTSPAEIDYHQFQVKLPSARRLIGRNQSPKPARNSQSLRKTYALIPIEDLPPLPGRGNSRVRSVTAYSMASTTFVFSRTAAARNIHTRDENARPTAAARNIHSRNEILRHTAGYAVSTSPQPTLGQAISPPLTQMAALPRVPSLPSLAERPSFAALPPLSSLPPLPARGAMQTASLQGSANLYEQSGGYSDHQNRAKPLEQLEHIVSGKLKNRASLSGAATELRDHQWSNRDRKFGYFMRNPLSNIHSENSQLVNIQTRYNQSGRRATEPALRSAHIAITDKAVHGVTTYADMSHHQQETLGESTLTAPSGDNIHLQRGWVMSGDQEKLPVYGLVGKMDTPLGLNVIHRPFTESSNPPNAYSAEKTKSFTFAARYAFGSRNTSSQGRKFAQPEEYSKFTIGDKDTRWESQNQTVLGDTWFPKENVNQFSQSTRVDGYAPFSFTSGGNFGGNSGGGGTGSDRNGNAHATLLGARIAF